MVLTRDILVRAGIREVRSQEPEEESRIALLFILSHKRLFGPLAHNQFVRRPKDLPNSASKLEQIYHHADAAIDQIVNIL